MRSTNKKFISALACASAMTALAIVDPMGVTKTHQVAQAATDTVPAKSTGVDVSSWQGTKLINKPNLVHNLLSLKYLKVLTTKTLMLKAKSRVLNKII